MCYPTCHLSYIFYLPLVVFMDNVWFFFTMSQKNCDFSFTITVTNFPCFIIPFKVQLGYFKKLLILHHWDVLLVPRGYVFKYLVTVHSLDIPTNNTGTAYLKCKPLHSHMKFLKPQNIAIRYHFYTVTSMYSGCVVQRLFRQTVDLRNALYLLYEFV